MDTKQKPTTEEIQQAILTLLGGLPNDCEMRFGWDNGQQCFTFRERADAPEQYMLVRKPDGTGRVVPGVLHS